MKNIIHIKYKLREVVVVGGDRLFPKNDANLIIWNTVWWHITSIKQTMKRKIYE